LRKQNSSVYDISEALKKEGNPRSPISVARVLKEEGFAKLPRRYDEERPEGVRPIAAEQSNAKSLCLEPRSFRTKYGLSQAAFHSEAPVPPWHLFWLGRLFFSCLATAIQQLAKTTGW